MMLSLTSGQSSFSWVRKRGNRCSTVLLQVAVVAVKSLVPQFQVNSSIFPKPLPHFSFSSHHPLLLSSEYSGEAHDDGCEGRLDVHVGVADQLFHAG